MMNSQDVSDHYTQGSLVEAIETALRAGGLSPEDVTSDDLMVIDEFHIGGRQASLELAEGIGLGEGDHVLDIGCGIGGPARFFAGAFGCCVTGIDLTEEYVQVARTLSEWTGFSDGTVFDCRNALDTGFGDASFDAATLLHVGMNIEAKEALFVEAFRVLRPGGRFAVYDVMRVGEGDIIYPVPWAGTEATSFVATPDVYKAALEAAGFEIVAERNRKAFALDFFRKSEASLKASLKVSGGPKPLGRHITMGADAPLKLANTRKNIEAGIVAPVEILAKKRR